MRNVSKLVVSFGAFVSFAGTFLALALTCARADAQTTDAVGVRAQGLAGAFTAVADDASAGFWNPAGIAGGPIVNGLFEYSKPDRTADETVRGFAAAYPAFGVSYYRLPISQIRTRSSTAATLPDRQDQGSLSLIGATFGQSIGDHFVVATTLKLLRANDTSADLDIGGMLTFGPARVGATLRNVSEPTIQGDAADFTLQRHVRAGFALSSGRRGVVGRATVSADLDLTTESTPGGDQRLLAVGGEAWAPENVVGIRGGFSHNTAGLAETLWSGGFSLALRKSTFVDAYVSTGDEVRHGWGLGLRVTF
jgi:hypothetical protein